ncbi:glycosyltransferase [Priestia megaterium]|uniref:glycosyltransferase n=1 Tax=Priestia megaterium TaxID=1404 RepID=UPI00345AB67D
MSLKNGLELEQAINFFEEKEYFKAYQILFEQFKQIPDIEILQIYLAVFAYATGNQELSDFYINKVGSKKFRNFISANHNGKLLQIMLLNSNEHSRWDNYRRLRNANEINRFGVTAPLCKGNVLEVGCANGDLSINIAMHADNLYGLDIEPVAVELARYKVNKLGLDNCFFALGDGANLSFGENSFDTVVLAEVLEHVQDPKSFIEEAVRVCKSGGKVLISVPKGYSIPDPDHVRIFTKESVLAIVNAVTSCKVNWINEVPSPWLMCYIEIDKGNVSNNILSKVEGFLPPHSLPKINFNEKVSIIIPTYNRCNYLKESLDSVLAQTYPNKEVIVVDDGSTDETEKILKEYKPFITHISKENGGKSSAINLGMERVTGDYIWIFDDDDIALPKKLEIQIRKFQENKSVGLIHTSAIYFQELDEDKKFIGKFDVKNLTPRDALKEQLKGNHFFTPSVIVRRECYDEVGQWDEGLVRAQDYDMWSRICRYSNTLGIAVPTLHYRVHSGIRGTKTENIRIDDLQGSTKKYHRLVVKKIHNIPIDEIFQLTEEGVDCYVHLIESLLERALYMAENDLFKECIQDIEQAKKFAVASKTQYLNLTLKGLQIIHQLDKVVNELGEPRAIINILFFIKMIKKANS